MYTELDHAQHENALGFSFLVVEIHQSLHLSTASFCALDRRLPAYVYGNSKNQEAQKESNAPADIWFTLSHLEYDARMQGHSTGHLTELEIQKKKCNQGSTVHN